MKLKSLVEALDPNSRFAPKSLVFTRREVFNALHNALQMQKDNNEAPQEAGIYIGDITDDVAQEYADAFGSLLLNFLRDNDDFMGEEMELDRNILKKLKSVRRRTVALRRRGG